MKKIKVPDGMLEAAHANSPRLGIVYLEDALEASLRWLAEHPIVPATAEAIQLLQKRVDSGNLSLDQFISIPITTIQFVLEEWQKQMFEAPQEEIDLRETEIDFALVAHTAGIHSGMDPRTAMAMTLRRFLRNWEETRLNQQKS